MGFFYLLHEYAERYHSNYPIGKKFARTVILGFIFYYITYFIVPLYFPQSYTYRVQHFLRYLIVIDIIASSIFYGGVLNGLSFWSKALPIAADLMENTTDDENIIILSDVQEIDNSTDDGAKNAS